MGGYCCKRWTKDDGFSRTTSSCAAGAKQAPQIGTAGHSLGGSGNHGPLARGLPDIALEARIANASYGTGLRLKCLLCELWVLANVEDCDGQEQLGALQKELQRLSANNDRRGGGLTISSAVGSGAVGSGQSGVLISC
jgi:hypothetical protein